MNNYIVEIERYFGHFEKEFSQVQSLQVTDGYHAAIYQKMIYVGITEPYARWCGRTAGETPPPTRLVAYIQYTIQNRPRNEI